MVLEELEFFQGISMLGEVKVQGPALTRRELVSWTGSLQSSDFLTPPRGDWNQMITVTGAHLVHGCAVADASALCLNLSFMPGP